MRAAIYTLLFALVAGVAIANKSHSTGNYHYRIEKARGLFVSPQKGMADGVSGWHTDVYAKVRRSWSLPTHLFVGSEIAYYGIGADSNHYLNRPGGHGSSENITAFSVRLTCEDGDTVDVTTPVEDGDMKSLDLFTNSAAQSGLNSYSERCQAQICKWQGIDSMIADYNAHDHLRMEPWTLNRNGMLFTIPAGFLKRHYKYRCIVSMSFSDGRAFKEITDLDVK